MVKLATSMLAVAVLLIIVGWAASAYLPAGIGAPATSSTTSTSAPLSAADVSAILGTKSQSTPLGDWLPDDPAFVGNSSNVDYPPGYDVLANFTLGVINEDRAAAGLSPVVLSDVHSGQQHADSMAYYRYFSHWDNQGYKPYMRYTLLGGAGSVTENLALNFCSAPAQDSARLAPVPCSIQTVESAIKASEWGMMNNDSACCNDGHRQNILGPIHNRVSVGVAYNSTTVYLVEDFEDSYISSESLQLSAGVVTFGGSLQQRPPNWMERASGAEIAVYYDPVPSNIGLGELGLLSMCSQYDELNEPASCQYQGAYNPGTLISTVFGPCPPKYVCAAGDYTYANSWVEYAGNFEIVFSLSDLESVHGNGVYTFYLWPAANAPEPITSLSVFVTSA